MPLLRNLFICLLLSAGPVGAQIFTQSPYSRFGVGELAFQGYADQQGMGQTGIALRDRLNMYLINPASYSALQKTNFRFGVRSFTGTIKQGDNSMASTGAGLNYLTLGFQINKNKTWGLSFGAIPFSALGYNIEFQHDSASGGYKDVLLGRGGLTRYFVGTGKSFGEHFSAGVQVSYLHVQTDFSRAIEYNNGVNLNYRESSGEIIGGFMYEAGAQAYFTQLRIKSSKTFDSTSGTYITRKDSSFLRHQFGATYSLSTKLNSTRTFFARTYVNSSGQEFVLDTVLLESDQKGKTTLPSTFGLGYALGSNTGKWQLAADFRMQMWSEFSPAFETQNLANSWQGGIGYSIRPSMALYDDKTAYLLRTQYRIGMRYGKTYLNLNNTDITTMAFSFGMGFPLRTRTVSEEFKYETVYSNLDISVEYLQKGTLNNNLIQENYWRFVVGISLNDKWFNKRKIE